MLTKPFEKRLLHKKTGRPGKASGPLRNMRLLKSVDEFLLGEKRRTKKSGMNGRELTFVVECALMELGKLKPSVRDLIYKKARTTSHA